MEIPQDIKEMLEPDEKILWCDKPLRAPFVRRSIGLVFIGIPWLVFPLIIIGMASTKFLFEPPVLLFLIFWYGILGFIFFWTPIYSSLVWKNIYYVLTNKRIIIRKGLVGIDYDVLNLDAIQQVNVNVGFWDRKYGTGTLTIQAIGVRPITLYAVKEPRKVYEIINRASRTRKYST
ncbi:PH domain-containing protein [Desulfurococcaceae archaeon MEX13E-LK6-19]|nr:PH domain-containing protein [Desulfurococcaceae archaeon MEX13E-LK6-19]